MATFIETISGIPGLVHYWPLNDAFTTQDVVGGATLSNTGSVTFSSAGAAFNGSNYLAAADQPDMSIRSTGGLTVLAFMSVSDWASGGRSNSNSYVHWLGKCNNPSGVDQHEYAFRHYFSPDTSGEGRTAWCSGYVFPSDGGLGAGSRYIDAGATATTSERVFAQVMDKTSTSGAGNIDSSNPGIIRAFLNGTQHDADGMSGYSVDFVDTNSPFHIGGHVGTGAYFKGTIRRVAIFNRALTSTEVQTIYAARGLAEGSLSGGGAGTDVTGGFKSTLQDNFTAGLSAAWSTVNNASAVGGAARITTAATAGSRINTGFSYALKGSQCAFKMGPVVNTTGGTASNTYTRARIYGAADTTSMLDIIIRPVAGTIGFRALAAGVDGTPAAGSSSLTYDPVAHAYVRFRESGGTTYFETSPDSLTWTIRRADLTPAWVTTAADLRLYIETLKDTGAASYADVDDVNTIFPSVPVVPTYPTEYVNDTFESYTNQPWAVGSPSPGGEKWLVDNLGGTPSIAGTAPDKYLILPGTLRNNGSSAEGDITVEVAVRRTTAPATQADAFQLWWGREYSRGDDQYRVVLKKSDGTDGWSLYKGASHIYSGSSTFGQGGTYQTLKVVHEGSTITVYRDNVELMAFSGYAAQKGRVVLTALGGSYRVGSVLATTPEDSSEGVPPDVQATIPGLPTTVLATPGPSQVMVGWGAAPGNGAAVTAYHVRVEGGVWVSLPASSSTYTFSSLSPGTQYSFSVRAANAIGAGPAVVVTGTPFVPSPVGAEPSEPTSVVAVPGSGSAALTWAAPSAGGPISEYRVYEVPSGILMATVSGSSLQTTVTGLINGSTYRLQVSAVNSAGEGQKSLPTAPVIPLASGSSTSPLYTRTSFGMYLGGTPFEPTEARVGQVFQPACVRLRLGEKLDEAYLASSLEYGRALYIQLDMSGFDTAKVIAGEYDDLIRSSAARALEGGGNVYIAPYFDANNWLMPWSPLHTSSSPNYAESLDCRTGSVNLLLRAFDRVVRVSSSLVSRNSATALRWVWQPMVDPYNSSTLVDWRDYDPGTLADVICLRGFNYGDGPLPGSAERTAWRSPSEVFDAPYAAVAALHPRKPIWLLTACHDPSSSYSPLGVGFAPGASMPADPTKSKVDWVYTLIHTTSYPRVQAVVWYSVSDARNWTLESSAECVNVIRDTVPGGGVWDRTDQTVNELGAYSREALTRFSNWLRRGCTWESPYERPDRTPAPDARGMVTFSMPYSAGTKALSTISVADMESWNQVHGVIERTAARNGLYTFATASGDRAANDPVLLFSGSTLAGRTELNGLRDGSPGVDMQSAGGMTPPKGGRLGLSLVPGPVVGLAGTSTSSTVSVSWSAPVPNDSSVITGYRISLGVEDRLVLDPALRSFTFTGLAPSTAYQVSVQAVNKEGSGEIRQAAVVTPALSLVSSRLLVSQPAGVGTAAQLRQGSDTGPRARMLGVNVWGVPCNDQWTADFANGQWANRATVVNTIKAWGANVVRLRLNASSYEAQSFALTKAQYLDRVQGWVDQITNAGMYTMICWWDAHDQKNVLKTEYSKMLPMMRDVYTRLGDRQSVLYEPFNEPNGVTWAEWQQAARPTVQYWRETIGYKGPLVMDTIGWSHGYDDAQMSSLETFDSGLSGMGGKHQIVFARHDYGDETTYNYVWNSANWKAATGGTAVNHVLFETEFGNYNFSTGAGTSSGAAWTSGAVGYFANGAFTERSNYAGAVAFLFGPWQDGNSAESNGMTRRDNVTPGSWKTDADGTVPAYNWGLTVKNGLFVSPTRFASNKMSNLSDDFSAASVSTATWPTQSAGLVSVSAGRLAVEAAPTYPVVKSTRYDMTNSYLFAKITPATPATSHQTFMQVESDAQNAAIMMRDGANLVARVVNAGVATNVTIGAYAAVTHQWWRIRHTGTNFLFDTSVDGVTWTQRATIAHTWSVISVTATLMAGKWQAGDPVAISYFDNINLAP